MTHPAIDEAAAARLRATLAAASTEPGAEPDDSSPDPSAAEPGPVPTAEPDDRSPTDLPSGGEAAPGHGSGGSTTGPAANETLAQTVTRAAVMARGRAKGLARRAAAPAVARLRSELAGVTAQDQDELRSEVASLRRELSRVRAEHAAEVAALHEEVAARRRPGPPT